MSKDNPILLIEDDPDIRALVRKELESLSFAVEEASDGQQGLELATNNDYQLVILDLGLPKLDGIEVCKQIRSVKKALPLLMLSSRADELDRILGLELGADDYMTKPFSIRELAARVKALLRRSDLSGGDGGEGQAGSLTFPGLEIHLDRRQVIVREVEVELTAMEFDLLSFLASNPGRAYSRSQLVTNVWQYNISAGYEASVTTLINRLRNKIELDPAEPVYIKTMRGVGYRFAYDTELSEIS